MDITRLTKPQRVSAIAILVISLAAFLPWVSVFGISVRGIRGDGATTLILALLGGTLLALSTGLFNETKPTGKAVDRVPMLLAVTVTVVGLSDMSTAADIGLYLTIFGGIAWTVGAVWQFSNSRHEVPADEGPASQD